MLYSWVLSGHTFENSSMVSTGMITKSVIGFTMYLALTAILRLNNCGPNYFLVETTHKCVSYLRFPCQNTPHWSWASKIVHSWEYALKISCIASNLCLLNRVCILGYVQKVCSALGLSFLIAFHSDQTSFYISPCLSSSHYQTVSKIGLSFFSLWLYQLGWISLSAGN